MDEIGFKVFSLFLLFLLTLSFCIFPVLFVKKIEKYISHSRRKAVDRILSLLSCFGAGVFLATCLLHLFPESVEAFEHAMKDDHDHDHDSNSTSNDNGTSTNMTTAVFYHDHGHGDEDEFPLHHLIMAIGFLFVLFVEQATLAYKSRKSPSKMEEEIKDIRSTSDSIRAIRESISIKAEDAAKLSMNSSSHNHSHIPDASSALSSVLLVLALSLHSIFEGMAIGGEDSIEKVGKLLIAVLIHKCIIAFTLGLNLMQSSFKMALLLECTIIFSIMSPLGIAIQLIVGAVHSEKSEITNAVLNLLASGTFLYVTCFEILPHEINNKRDRLLKQLFLNVGFYLMALAIYLFPA